MVPCSAQPDPRNLRPFLAVFDTGSGQILIRKSALFVYWERYLVQNETIPRLRDANGRPLRFLGVVLIRARFGDSMLNLPFVVADSRSVDITIGTRFMNNILTPSSAEDNAFSCAAVAVASRLYPTNPRTKFRRNN